MRRGSVGRGVVDGLVRARVEYGETTVDTYGELQIVGGVRRGGDVGDKFGLGIMNRAAFFREMQLPHGSEIWRGLDDVERGGAATFFCAIIDDRNMRFDGMDENGRAALIEAMM